MTISSEDWNYFTEIEAYFQVQRGTPGRILSIKDFSLADKWEKAGIPLDVVLRGIDISFERYRRSSHGRNSNINGLAYCEPVIMELWAKVGAATPEPKQEPTPEDAAECQRIREELEADGWRQEREDRLAELDREIREKQQYRGHSHE